MDKAATTGSARSFGAAVGAKTKKFINGSAGSELSGTSRDENLPRNDKFQPKYESPKEKVDKSSLKHPVRPNGDSVAEMVKEAAHRCDLRKSLTKDKTWEELCISNLEKQAGAGSIGKSFATGSMESLSPAIEKIMNYLKNPAGGKGTKEGFRQASKVGLNVGLPVAGAYVTDAVAGKHMEEHPFLRLALAAAGGTALSPAQMRRAHSKAMKELSSEMSTRPDFIAARKEYFKKHNVSDFRDRATHADDASEHAADKIRSTMSREALLPAATKHGMTSTATMAIPGMVAASKGTMGAFDKFLNEEIDAPMLDAYGNQMKDKDGKPLFTKKSRFEDVMDSTTATTKQTGKAMKTLGTETSKTSKAIQGIAGGSGKKGEKGLADRLNTVAAKVEGMMGDMAGGIDVVKGFMEKNPWVIKGAAGAGAAGALVLLYKKLISDPQKEEERRKQKEREIKALNRMARATEKQI